MNCAWGSCRQKKQHPSSVCLDSNFVFTLGSMHFLHLRFFKGLLSLMRITGQKSALCIFFFWLLLQVAKSLLFFHFEQVSWILQVWPRALPPVQAARQGQRKTSNLCRWSLHIQNIMDGASNKLHSRSLMIGSDRIVSIPTVQTASHCCQFESCAFHVWKWFYECTQGYPICGKAGITLV